jgi:hypothetical protein
MSKYRDFVGFSLDSIIVEGSCIEGYLINLYKFPLNNFHLYKTFQTGSALQPGTHKQPQNHAILAWILAAVIMAPNLRRKDFPPAGKDPAIAWSRFSQNLGDNKKFQLGWVLKYVLSLSKE